jgi:hypothetical protein
MFAAPKSRDDDVIEDVEVIEDDVEIVDDVEVVDEGPSRTPQRMPSSRPAKPPRVPAVNSGIEVVDDEVEVIEDEAPVSRPRKEFRAKKRGSGSKGVLIGAIAGGVVLLLAGGGLAWWLLRGGGDEPLAYLPANSPFVGGADVKAIFGSPLAGPAASLIGLPTMPFGRIVAATNAPMRDSLDRVVFGAGKNGMTMAVKTAVPIDKEKLAAAYGDANIASVGGQKVFRSAPPGPKSLFIPSKTIAVVSDLPDDQLATIARSSGRTSALSGDAESLAAKFNGNTIWLIVGPEGFSDPAIQAGMMPALLSSPAGKSIAPIMQSARGFGLSINLGGSDVEIRIGIQCADAAAAQKTVADLNEMNEKSKSDLATKAMLQMAPAWAKKLHSEMEANTQVNADGSLALINMRVSMSTVQEAADALSALMNSASAVPSAGNMGAMVVPKNNAQRPGSK